MKYWTCPFCGKNPKKEISNVPKSKALEQINFPLAFMIAFIILGALTIGITLLIHKVLVGSSFSLATILEYCSVPISIGFALMILGVLIFVASFPKVRKLLGKIKVVLKPEVAVLLGLALLAFGGFLTVRGFSYKESEISILSRQVAEYANYHGAYDIEEGAEKMIDHKAEQRLWEGIGGIVLGFIGFCFVRAGASGIKENKQNAKKTAEANQQTKIDRLKQGKVYPTNQNRSDNNQQKKQ